MDQSNPTPDPRASILAPNASELTITVPGISPTETSLRLSPLPPSLSMSFPLGGMTPASISGVTGHAPMLSTMSSYSIGLGPSDLSLTSVAPPASDCSLGSFGEVIGSLTPGQTPNSLNSLRACALSTVSAKELGGEAQIATSSSLGAMNGTRNLRSGTSQSAGVSTSPIALAAHRSTSDLSGSPSEAGSDEDFLVSEGSPKRLIAASSSGAKSRQEQEQEQEQLEKGRQSRAKTSSVQSILKKRKKREREEKLNPLSDDLADQQVVLTQQQFKNRQIIHETNTSQAEVDALGGLFNLAGDSSVSSKASSGADFGSAEKASKVTPKPVPKPPLNIQYMAHSSELLEPMILTQPDGTPRAPGVPRRARNTNNYDSSKAIKCPHCVYSSDYPGHVKSHVINIHFPERAKWHYCDVQGCGYKAKTRPDVKRHKQNRHDIWDKNERRMFPCEREGCNYVSKNAYDTVRHMKSHEGTVKHLRYKCKLPECNFYSKNATRAADHSTHDIKYIGYAGKLGDNSESVSRTKTSGKTSPESGGVANLAGSLQLCQPAMSGMGSGLGDPERERAVPNVEDGFTAFKKRKVAARASSVAFELMLEKPGLNGEEARLKSTLLRAVAATFATKTAAGEGEEAPNPMMQIALQNREVEKDDGTTTDPRFLLAEAA